MNQRHVHSPIQLYNLSKSFIIIFAIQAVIVLLAPREIIADPWRFLILALNIIVAMALGWRLYKHRYHMVFTYNDEGFILKKGEGEEAKYRWNDFSRVSLFRTEYGELAVRLYLNEEFFDLPASKLKLNPFDFRREAMKFVSAHRDEK
ncbi:MAG: hypothetical protein OEZ25_04185 [Candidatus Bathyarchaeota archaeon]|nr:hypothetical protein [Candidatus Bathyarchaeota archaeon]